MEARREGEGFGRVRNVAQAYRRLGSQVESVACRWSVYPIAVATSAPEPAARCSLIGHSVGGFDALPVNGNRAPKCCGLRGSTQRLVE
jgi:hypothetical protein